MSRKGTDAARVPLDAYFTPSDTADFCVGLLPIEGGECVWEPHAGNASFVTALRKRGHYVVASDINPEALALSGETLENGEIIISPYPADAVFTSDALTVSTIFAPHWVVGNPPYNIAEECIRAALRHAVRGVAFLLRVNILGGQARTADLWLNGVAPALIHVVPKRPAFIAVCKEKTCKKKYPVGITQCTCGGKVTPGSDATEYAFIVWWSAEEYERVWEEETRGKWGFESWRQTFPRVKWHE